MCEYNGVNLDSTACTDLKWDGTAHQNMASRAEEMVTWTNNVYRNSKIATQLRLVHVHFTPDVDDRTYSCGSILEKFTFGRPADGHWDYWDLDPTGIMDDALVAKNTWGADMAALLTSSRVGGCGGIAYLGGDEGDSCWYCKYLSFSVTLQNYGPTVFAHEARMLLCGVICSRTLSFLSLYLLSSFLTMCPLILYAGRAQLWM